MNQQVVTIIGGGLAGCEAAWQVAERGVKVRLYEMRQGARRTEAHQTDHLAELVCSNSFRNDEVTSAIGLLHEEMRLAGSLIMQAADTHKVPAGSALAMDRVAFSQHVEKAISTHPLITLVREEITALPSPEAMERVIIATGPLTSPALSEAIRQVTGVEYLAFFDAIAPIVMRDSINMDIAWFQSRYDKPGPGGTGKDYINCPMTEEEYHRFVDALLEAECTEFKEWEKNTPYFNGCLPIEVMAERGRLTLAFGPMKPVGLTNPHHDAQPFAVVQLRQDNKLGTLFNMVGFQTKMKYGTQKQVFSMIPGLENAEFARFGGVHRNTFINSPKLLNATMQLKALPHIRFAGQITGVEGYVESAATGLIVGRMVAAECLGQPVLPPPAETALGALIAHITGGAESSSFQPMNINFGLFPPLIGKIKKINRPQAYADRALVGIRAWLNNS